MRIPHTHAQKAGFTDSIRLRVGCKGHPKEYVFIFEEIMRRKEAGWPGLLESDKMAVNKKVGTPNAEPNKSKWLRGPNKIETKYNNNGDGMYVRQQMVDQSLNNSYYAAPR